MKTLSRLSFNFIRFSPKLLFFINVPYAIFQERLSDGSYMGTGGQDGKDIILQHFIPFIIEVSMRNDYVIHHCQKLLDMAHTF
jgi:hypothetical protein